MNKRLGIAAIGSAGALAVGAVVVPAALASPGTTSHTLHFVSVTVKQKQLSSKWFTQSDKDVKNGKVIGYDVLLFRATSNNTAAGQVAFATKGGFIYGKVPVTFNGTTFNGKVTGGTGAFKGASGTLLAHNLNQAGTRTAVTLTFTTP
jgi:hypothetical protein